MKILEALRKGARYYRASQGAKIDKRRRMGKELILDGVFNKNDDLAVAFSKSEAFSELFFELAYDEAKSKEFFEALIPKDLINNAIIPS